MEPSCGLYNKELDFEVVSPTVACTMRLRDSRSVTRVELRLHAKGKSHSREASFQTCLESAWPLKSTQHLESTDGRHNCFVLCHCGPNVNAVVPSLTFSCGGFSRQMVNQGDGDDQRRCASRHPQPCVAFDAARISLRISEPFQVAREICLALPQS